jgi:hemolysin activation/secretion protein
LVSIFRIVFAGAALSLLGSAAAYAQQLPDAGSVLQQIERRQRTELPHESQPPLALPAPLESIGGVTVTVNDFRFAGNTLLSDKRLAAAVAPFVGHPIDFTALQNAAIAVAGAYREAGWVVRAYLPRQDVTEGTVTIQIVEAKFGSVHVEGDSKRASTERVARFVERAQPHGEPVSAAALDRGLLLINDLPGVVATGRLSAGSAEAETDLTVDVEDGPLVTGNLVADDAGSRFTGAARVIASASLNGRLGIGDRADAVLLHSEGSDYVRLAYELPVGSRGWRIGVNASHLDYDIVTDDFAALDAHGSSSSAGMAASYPLHRSRLRNLYLQMDVGQNRFDNKSAGETATHYGVQSASVGLFGNRFDGWHGGGATTYGATLIAGEVDLTGSPNAAADAVTTRTDGGFRTLRLSASRLQALTERVALFASIEGQAASKNLDSSQKLYLGGSQGVRAYPESEAGGSSGLLATLEARAHLAPQFDLAGFVDWGKVRINEDNDFIGAAELNDVALKGGGVRAAWHARSGLSLTATFASRSGQNPLRTANGDDQDGSLVENRVWVQFSMPF